MLHNSSDGGAVGYSDIRDSLDTFDLVLWSDGEKLARLIQYGTNSIWTHVGMVVRFPGDVIMLWESTFDAESSGVRLNPLSKAIDGGVSIRRASLLRTHELFDRLMGARKILDGRPFENNLLEFICAAYDGPLGLNQRNITALFCSELIAETLQMVGLLDKTKPSNEYTPDDFSSGAKTNLVLLNGLSYGPEIPIVNVPSMQSAKQYNKAKCPIVSR